MTFPELASRPYQSLAKIYDFVMRHVDYDEWASHIVKIIERYNSGAERPEHLVDLACGTGNITSELYERGYRVSGVDGAESMRRVAQEKSGVMGFAIEYHHCDLRRLAGLGPFDCATCLYDSFNYLLNQDDVVLALEQIYGILRPGAIFVFDVCTERNSLLYFQDVEEEESGPGFSYTRHSRYDRKLRLQYNEFRICFDGSDKVLEELHCQRIYYLNELEDAVATSPFELLETLEGFEFSKGSETSERVHFVLRRPVPRIVP